MFTLGACAHARQYADGIVFSMPRRMTQRFQTGSFHQPDPLMHMLRLPRSRQRIEKWTLLVFFAGILIALMLIAITNFLP